MRQKFLLTLLLSLFTGISFAQVTIIVPTGPDTVICDGAPLTMIAAKNGYIPHPVTWPYSTDDGYTPSYPIGFTFNYYGNNYTNFVISSNGFITFNTSLASSYSAYSISTGIPGNSYVPNAVLGSYSDLVIASGTSNVTYGIAGVAPYRKLVVRYCDATHFSCTSLRTSMEIILYETTNIAEVHIQHKDACGSWNSGAAIEGVQNNGYSVATPAPGRNYPGTWTVVAPDARRFTPNSAATSYTCDTIPYAPIPDTSAIVMWFSGTTLITSSTVSTPTVTVNPSVPTTYTALAVSCHDSSRDMVNVVIGSGPVISSITTTSPTVCGMCNGSVTLHGLTPGTSDTVKYYLGAVLQPVFVGVPDAAGDLTIPGLCGGTYTNFTVKVGYCTSPPYASATVPQPPFNISTVSTIDPTHCGMCNGRMTINGLVPGYSDTVNYTYNGIPQPAQVFFVPASGSITLTNLCDGSYTAITVKMNSCIANVPPQAINDPAFVISGVSHIDPTVCGACDGSMTISGLDTGFTDTVTFVRNGVPQPPVILYVPASGSITISNLCAGIYTNISVKMNTCTSIWGSPDTLTNPEFLITSTSSNDASCSACDGTMTLNGLTPNVIITVNITRSGVPQPAVTLTTNTAGSVTLTNLCPGVYSNITAHLNTCSYVFPGTITISAPPLIPIAVTAVVQPTECGMCNGRITIKGAPPGPIDTIFYNLNGVPQTPLLYSAGPDSTITIFNLCVGTYSNFFIKVGPCPTTTITTPVVLSAAPLVPAFTYTSIPGCLFDVFNFNNGSSSPTGNLWYIWHFGDGTTDTSRHPTHSYPPGTYHVTLVITNHFCVDSISTDININHPINAGFASDTLACQKNPVTFTNSSAGSPSPLTYLWSFGDGSTSTDQDPVHTFNNVGTYTVRLISSNGVPCRDTAYGHVFVDSLSGLVMTLSDTAICQATYITMEAIHSSVGYTGITWNFGNGDSASDVNPVLYAYPGTGVFTITTTVGFRICPDLSVSRNVTIVPQPIIALGPDTAICPGSETVQLADWGNVTTPGASWLWNTGETAYNILVVTPGAYYATVTVGNCHASDSVVVNDDCYMAMPNIFTPNGDGVNDFFYPRSLLSSGLTGFKMQIYNRWGEMIFSTTSVDGRGWDGKYNDILQPEGVYVYIIDGTFRDGKKEHHQGNITLLR